MKVIRSGLLPELLTLGVPAVDVQHDAIFCRIEDLKFTCIELNALPVVLADELMACLREHFATEERLAAEVGVEFGEHALIHAQTLMTLEGLIGQVLAEQRDIFSFLRYLEVWFERHIRDEDLPFAAALHASGLTVGAQAV